MGDYRERSQHGASAIEFVLVFPLLFALFYAVAGYGLSMVLYEAMVHAASDAARAALDVDWRAVCPPPTDGACIQQAVTERARNEVGDRLKWLPPTIQHAVLGANNGNVEVQVENGETLRVVVRHNDFQKNGFVPAISLPVIGDIPRLPAQLVAEGRVSLGGS
jgi:hypothetical protein